VRYVDVVSAQDLLAACEGEFPHADVLLMAAAVADFRPAQAAATKLKKDGREGLELALEPTPDVLSGLAAQRRAGQVLVGFAAEHGANAVEYGRGKLERKGLDAVVVNDISRPDIGFEGDHNEVTIVTAAGDEHVERSSKAEVARAICDVVVALRAKVVS
jgi:phosphopantothenoylcysteine decarboxylase / phosphopantothenate---cysteine ligase